MLFLKAKNWQIFILLVVGFFLSNKGVTDIAWLSNAISITGFVMYFLWIIVVGHLLQEYLPPRVTLNYNFFVINYFIWMGAIVVISLLSNGEEMNFTGWAALPFFYIFYAFFHSLAFVAKTIRTIEKGETVSGGEYVGDFFLVLFLPIGIWFLQPRINGIVKRKEK